MLTYRVAVFAVAGFLSAMSLSAQTVAGEDAMGFSRIAMNPRQSAMGFAGTASTCDVAWSALSSSAAIPFSADTLDAEAAYQRWAPDGVSVSGFGAGAAYRFGEFGLSLGVVGRRGEEYSLADENGIPSGTFRTSDMELAIGAGYRISDWISVGINAKYLSSKLSEGNSLGSFVMDLTGMYSQAGLSVVAGVRNLGSSVEDSQGAKYKPSSSVMAGLSFRHEFVGVHSLEGVLDGDYYFSGAGSLALGVEYGYDDLLFVRAGYHYGSDDCVLPSFASLGLGVQFHGVRFDFAYLTANDYVGNTLSFGLGYSF